MEDLTTKVTGNTLLAAEFVQPMEEIQTVIQKSGIVLSSGDSQQMAKALSTLVPSASFMSCTGVMPTKVLTSINSHQVIDSYVDGMTFRFRSGDSNGVSGATIDVDSKGAKAVRRMDNGNIASGDISSVVDSEIRYDLSTDTFLLINPQSIPEGVGYIKGMALSNSATDLLWDIAVDAGSCADSTGTYLLTLGAATSKDTRIVWTTAASNGAKVADVYEPSPVTSASPFWAVFVIGGPTVETSWGIDTGAGSTDAGNLRLTAGAGYTKFRHIGYIQPTGPGGQANKTHLLRFKVSQQDPNYVEYHVQGNVLFAPLMWTSNPSVLYNRVLNLTVPRETTARTVFNVKHNATDLFIKFHEYLGISTTTGPAPTIDDCSIAMDSGIIQATTVVMDIETNGLSQIAADFSRTWTISSAENIALKVLGFRFDRSGNSPFES